MTTSNGTQNGQREHATRMWDGGPPYTRGTRAPWRKTWGPLTDYHSRLGRLARRIYDELALVYDVSRPVWAAKVRDAAELKALVAKAKSELGLVRGVTVRQITAMTMSAERLLSAVARDGGALTKATPTLAERMAQMHAERERGT